MSANAVELTLTEQEMLRELLSITPSERENAWGRIYKTFYPMIRDFITGNNGTVHDATDIFQDALMILHRNLENGKFRGESSLKTYFYSICKNLWLKELNKKQKLLTTSYELPDTLAEETQYLLNVDVVSELMNELSDECREVLTEFYFNHRSMAELKDMFKVNSIQAAKNKKWRCMNCLARIFKERGILPVNTLQ